MRRLPPFALPPLRPSMLALSLSLVFATGGAHAQVTATGGLDNVALPVGNVAGFLLAGAPLPMRISADGGTVVGNYVNLSSISPVAFTYRPSTGLLPLPTDSGNLSFVTDISGDGSRAVGVELSPLGSSNMVLWNLTTNTKTVIAPAPSLIGQLGGTISTDGRVVAGSGIFPGPSAALGGSAMRLVLGGTPENLDPGLKYTDFSTVTALNDNGDVAVGAGSSGGTGPSGTSATSSAFRWTAATGLVDIGKLHGGTAAIPLDVNAAGDVVVGAAADGDLAAGNAFKAFRWTAATGMVSLGTLDGQVTSNSFALGVDGSGNVVVGMSGGSLASGSPTAPVFNGFRWTAATGMQTIEQWLTSKGVAVAPSAVHVQSAEGVSANGNVVTGTLSDGNIYVARVVETATPPADPADATPPPPPPSSGVGSGLINIANYTRSLQAASLSAGQAIQDADMVMTGAHGSPMRGLISGSQQYVWSTGDWGRADVSNSDHSNIGAIEVGYAHGLGEKSMAKIAIGRTYSDQDTLSDGNIRTHGTYLLPELIAAIPGTPLYGTLSGYYNFGDADVRRGYDNAGNQVHSTGSASQDTWSVQGRLDWLNAVQLNRFALTPYAAVLYSRTHMGSYTEKGGGFPAEWASRSDHSTLARLGLDGVYDLSDSIKLLGRVEGVHRFESKSNDVNGEILGLSAFSLDGQSYKQNWLRFGAGIEAGVGKGTVSLYGNATTEAETPRYWVSVGYRLPF